MTHTPTLPNGFSRDFSEAPSDEPYENSLSLEELRREVRRLWDNEAQLVKALRELPEVPHWRVQRVLGRAAKFPEDGNIGKRLQNEHGLDAIAPKTEYEMGAGLWWRIREGLTPGGTPRHGMRANHPLGAPPMPPDIREKAERLAGAAPLHIRIQPEGVSFDADPYADIISQALLEAHKAGREEAAKLIEANMLVGDGRDGTERLHPRTNPGNKVGFAYASAIRSLP